MATQYITPSTVIIAITAGSPIVVSIPRNDFQAQLSKDLDTVFYGLNDFAETITYRFRNGKTQSLDVIFDEEYTVEGTPSEAPAIISEPRFHAHTTKFVYRPDKGDTAVIRNREFTVKEAYPDGTGVMVITLTRD